MYFRLFCLCGLFCLNRLFCRCLRLISHIEGRESALRLIGLLIIKTESALERPVLCLLRLCLLLSQRLFFCLRLFRLYILRRLFGHSKRLEKPLLSLRLFRLYILRCLSGHSKRLEKPLLCLRLLRLNLFCGLSRRPCPVFRFRRHVIDRVSALALIRLLTEKIKPALERPVLCLLRLRILSGLRFILCRLRLCILPALGLR